MFAQELPAEVVVAAPTDPILLDAQWGAGPFPTGLARFEIDKWPLLVSLSEPGFGLLVTP